MDNGRGCFPAGVEGLKQGRHRARHGHREGVARGPGAIPGMAPGAQSRRLPGCYGLTGMAARACDPSTREAEAGGSPSSRPAWAKNKTGVRRQCLDLTLHQPCRAPSAEGAAAQRRLPTGWSPRDRASLQHLCLDTHLNHKGTQRMAWVHKGQHREMGSQAPLSHSSCWGISCFLPLWDSHCWSRCFLCPRTSRLSYNLS